MSELKTALIIDDDFLMQGVVTESLQQGNIAVFHAGTPDEALRALDSSEFDLIFSNPDMIKAIPRFSHTGREPVHIVMTSFAKVDKAIDWVKNRGAYDYLIKPFSSDQVGIVVEKTRALILLKAELKSLKGQDPHPVVQAEAPRITTITEASNFNLEELEKQTIIRVMQETGGSRSMMAEKLGISIRTLRNKLNKYREAELPQLT